MADTKALLAIILLLFLLSLFHIPKASSNPKPAGFSLKLIRAYSPESSRRSHRNNTFRERYESYVHASKARASYWTSFNKSSANKTIHPDVIQPPLTNEGVRIVVEMRIGTPTQKVFLEFDTGGLFSWTQSAYCTTCFPQSTPKFDLRRSQSYRAMSPTDPNCNPPVYINTDERLCLYESVYISDQYSKGIASYDKFASIENNVCTYTGNIRFGCSMESLGMGFPPNTIISGILGMSRHPESFPGQLNQYGGNGRFSYCLVDINTTPRVVNKVTFGDDVPNTAEEYLKTVPFIEHPIRHVWSIKLLDISVGEERLNLPPGTFDPNPSGGNGGLILDTGSIFTFLPRYAYIRIISKIQEHLSRPLGHFTQIHDREGLCYRYNQSSRRDLMHYLQTVTFHLDGSADLYMSVTGVYHFDWADMTFCLGMLEAASNFPNILGSLQQQDTRFIYDLNRNSLSFHPDICAG